MDAITGANPSLSLEVLLNGKVELQCGDCLAFLKTVPANWFDSIVTDPPYALVSIGKRFGTDGAAPVKVPENGTGAYARASAGFMGKRWDTGETAFAIEFWQECLRVLKPGGHVVAFGGTRTYHRLACAIEDGGFEIRDQIGWCFGSGFPKSHDLAKAIDKTEGIEFEASPASGVGFMGPDGPGGYNVTKNKLTRVGESSAQAAQWQGWGTALKPAWEPICLARKPLSEKTVAANVLRWGTGAINVDGCRVPTDDRPTGSGDGRGGAIYAQDEWTRTKMVNGGSVTPEAGRWPANVVHDGSEEVLAAFPDAPGQQARGTGNEPTANGFSGAMSFSGMKARIGSAEPRGDSGSAARFFYSSKADADDRLGSKHPTVKPVDLMQWLVRLITPKGGLVLDPFAGTGTTAEACIREGMRCMLVERETEYQADIRRRMDLVMAGPAERIRESIKAKGLTADAGPLFGGTSDAT